MSIVDAPQREAALDPSRSFIVQAPAGSGKTGLLIQRFLRLLAVVERPEEILAITFTRKAAAEMRRRVLQALDRAASATPPQEANERTTWELARAALERDRDRDWQLARNAARLRIQTIDALCASLARQMPVLARLGAAPIVVDDPRDLYREATERTLALVEKDEAESPLARMVLRHLDGDWSVVRRLIAEIMLPKRDQWMRRIEGFTADDQVRAALERGFCAERTRLMKRAGSVMPVDLEAAIVESARFAAANVEEASPLRALSDCRGCPPCDEVGAAAWTALAHLFLTKEGEWRATVTKKNGFPATGATEKARKDAMLKLLERLRPLEETRVALQALRKGPPAAFTDAQWEILGALVDVLRRAAAELKKVFAERGEIDFGGIAQAAVEALGDEDAPTDLLLALDVRIQHLLVDEFQDTSLTQWELLKRLTAGWTEDDGRTAFLVGDPMQSIYRFREAEVALFLRAREKGLPSVRLVPLTLQTNFRSQSGIVEWVNDTFGAMLPRLEDPDSGAVPYAPSSAHHPALATGEAVQWHPFTGPEPEAGHEAEGERVARLARDAEPGSVAILVRARGHLDRIVPALKKAGVRFRAVDIEPLNRRPVIQDLLAITRALGHLADRVAWLAILRAPWCALTMADMNALLNSPERSELTVWELLGDTQRMAGLSREGAARAARTHSVLAPFVEGRSRGPLRERVESAWLALGGPACVERESDLEDAETFFDRLEDLDEAGELADPTLLEEDLEWLRAAPDVGEEARVQVMTIHRAKGLEFDTVIIPGMERVPRGSDKPLFGWKARADGTLMMAPVRRTDETEEPAYDYLRRLEIDAGDHELDRVFYVAVTRARKRLHLLGFARTVASGLNPPSETKSLLGRAWEMVKGRFEAATALARAPAVDLGYRQEVRTLDLATLEVQVAAPPPPPLAPLSPDGPPRFDWASETAIHVGTVTHRWLQRIGEEGIERWGAERVPGLAPVVARELERRGIPAAERATAAERVIRGLAAAISDERGRWILASHPGSRCEYRLRVATPEGVRLIVIDRLVVDASGRRWIVDYKSGEHQGGELEGFLDNELERYAPQLTRYLGAFPRGEATAALYFPLVRGWRELGRV